MSLHPQAVPPVPQSTARVARAAFRRGNVYMRMRDEFGALYTDESFAPLFPTRGQSAEAPLAPGARHDHAIRGRIVRSPSG